MHIEINKTLGLASIHGGDAGPGSKDPAIGMGITYTWVLPIAQLEPDPDRRTLVLNTLNGVISVIAAVAQSSAQSLCFVGSGGYYGNDLSISGTSEQTLGNGQLQCIGSEIDLSSVNDPNLPANIGSLPVGTFAAQPKPGCTKWVLSVTISD